MLLLVSLELGLWCPWQYEGRTPRSHGDSCTGWGSHDCLLPQFACLWDVVINPCIVAVTGYMGTVAWYPAVGTIWEGLGGVVLEEV